MVKLTKKQIKAAKKVEKESKPKRTPIPYTDFMKTEIKLVSFKS